MLSLVIPAYNEGKHIYENLKVISDEVSKFTDDFELLVVNDGSKDNTWDEVKRAQKDIPHVVDCGYEINRGKGGAIKEGVSKSHGDMVGFIDADLDLHPKLLENFYEALKEDPNTIAIGSKMHKDSKLDYPASRKMFSVCYFIMLKVLFGLSCHDTQTGMKVYPGDILRSVVQKQRVSGFAFDIEQLALANQAGAKIKEMPIEINFSREESFGRIKFKDIWKMFTDTWSIWWNLRIKKSYGKL